MNQTKQPSKELIRQWLTHRQRNRGPLPTIEEIKSELRWHISHARSTGRNSPKIKPFYDQSTQRETLS
jgi:hypothetical protein